MHTSMYALLPLALLLALLAAPGAAWPAAVGELAARQGAACSQAPKLDCVGADISNAPTKDFAACCALCHKTQGCQAFSLDAFDGKVGFGRMVAPEMQAPVLSVNLVYRGEL